MRIDRPGVYEMSAEDYHADPCEAPSLSSSVAKLLINSTPLHAWTAHPRLNPDAEREDEERFDLGNACHSLILHDPKKFEIIDAPDWRTKQAKDQREAARECGKIPLLAEQWTRVQAMAHSLRLQLARHQDARNAFTNGKPEQTLIWREGETWCRARLDWLPNAGNFFDDYKSTVVGADPDAFSRNLFNLGYDVQDAFYTRGIRALGLCEKPAFRFIVQETQAPHAISVVALMPSAVDLAAHKVARAIDIWQTCMRTGYWPGYPLRTCYVEAPAWHEAQFIARDSRAYDAEKDGRASTEFHRPLETTT